MEYDSVREDNVNSYLSVDHIWPPTVQANPSHPIVKAIKEVLLRLPEDEFYEVESYVQVIIEDQESLAFNVSFNRPIERLDTIVIYERSFKMSHKALVGLLAHELAHTFVDEKEHFKNEAAVNELARSWGFTEEIKILDREITKHRHP